MIKCRLCGKDVNPNSAICPFCGGRLIGTLSHEKPLCPRCKVSLEINQKEDLELDICPECGGLWLDRQEFHILTAPSNVYQEEKLTEEYARPPLEDNVHYLCCMRCGKLMTRTNFAKISGVIIDRCGKHGVWLDKGELEKIRHFIADGGLEHSQDREIEKNRQELKDLATTVKDTAFTHKLIHFWNWKRWFFS